MNDKIYFLHESSYVDENVLIEKDVKIWHFCHILGNTSIGSGTSIGQNCMVGPNVKVGKNCKIQNNVSLYDGLELEDSVFLGPSCVFTNVTNPRSGINRKDQFKKTLIQEGASIGANSTIICGVIIGHNCLIGAGAVVSKDVKPNSLVVGVPAKQVGWVSDTGEILDKSLYSKEEEVQYLVNRSGELVKEV